jgi:hypothetical protein
LVKLAPQSVTQHDGRMRLLMLNYSNHLNTLEDVCPEEVTQHLQSTRNTRI